MAGSQSLLLVAPALAFATVVISLLPTAPNDLWWHMRVGQLIVETGQVPTVDLFAWTVPPGTPYAYGAWLGEVLLYRLYQLGGIELMLCLRNLLAGALLGLVALEARRRVGSWRFAGLAVLGAGLLLLSNINARPQMFAWVPFGLTVLLLGRYVDGQLRTGWLVALLTLLTAFWVNVHGSFVLGPLLVGAALAGEALPRLRDPGALRAAPRARGLALALATVALATLANPRGIGIYDYVRSLLSDVPTQRYIVEWQPPTPDEPVFAAFYLSVLALLAVWAIGREPPRPADAIVVCGLLWLAWRSERYVPWYGVVAMPVLAEAVARVRGQLSPAPVARPARSRHRLLAALLVLPVVVAQPWFGRTQPLVTWTPVAAADELRAHPGGRLFNDLTFGSYLIWAVPEQPVFVDPRLELYPEALVEDYGAIGDGRDAVSLLARYGVDRAFISRARQPRLSAALRHDGAWAREYADDDAEIWRRQEALETGPAR